MSKSMLNSSWDSSNNDVEFQSSRSMAMQTPPILVETEAKAPETVWKFQSSPVTLIDHDQLFTDFEGDEDMLKSYLSRSGKYLLTNLEDVMSAIKNFDFSLALQGGNRMLGIASTLRAVTLESRINQLKSLIIDENQLESQVKIVELRSEIHATHRILLNILSTM